MMLKSLTVGLLTLGTAFAGTAFANSVVNGGNGRQDSYQCEKHRGCDQQDDRHVGAKILSRPTPTPEIDPAGALGALTLLAGGLAVMRGRQAGKSAV